MRKQNHQKNKIYTHEIFFKSSNEFNLFEIKFNALLYKGNVGLPLIIIFQPMWLTYLKLLNSIYINLKSN